MENNISSKIKYFGKVEHSRLIEVMQTFDILVLPSFSKGLPHTILKGMASGTYCVASESGGGTSFLLENGALGSMFNPTDFIALSEILKTIYDNPIDKSLLAAARKRVENFFTLEKEVTKYVSCFNALWGEKFLGK